MNDAFFFGYGSLVNRETHEYGDAQATSVRGWRREWRVSKQFGRTFLSAVRDHQAVIDGLVARVPQGDWAALDAREAGYARHMLETGDFAAPAPAPAQIYAIAPEVSALPDQSQPIKLSYLDVVVAGFFSEFGETGVTRFFETTTGWAATLDDRTAPLYARARPVTAHVRDMVDAHLARLNVHRLRS